MPLVYLRFATISALLVLYSCSSLRTTEKMVQVEEPLPPKVFTLPAGTRFSVRIPKPVSSSRYGTGSTIEGELAAPIAAFGETIAPRGTPVIAVVSDSTAGATVNGLAEIALRATQLRMNGGVLLNISTDEPRFYAPERPAREILTVDVSSAGATGVEGARNGPAVIPAEYLIGFRLRNPVQVSVNR